MTKKKMHFVYIKKRLQHIQQKWLDAYKNQEVQPKYKLLKYFIIIFHTLKTLECT